jgi:hypothetical protein
MHVYISHPASREDLRAFLERADCVARERNAQELEVDVPRASSEAHARRALNIYLATWQMMNRGVETYVVERDQHEVQ